MALTTMPFTKDKYLAYVERLLHEYLMLRQVIDKLNIGFDHPSQDDCGETATDLSHNSMICICIRYNAHKQHYTSARHAYKEDKELNTDWGPQSIIVKYFEPGKSFMKADPVRGQIGRKRRKRSQILASQDKGFRKDSRPMFYKRSFCDVEYHEEIFLKNKFDTNQQPTPYRNDRGVNSAKKAKIMNELCASMESGKQLFLRQLPINDDVPDLLYKSGVSIQKQLVSTAWLGFGGAILHQDEVEY
nr:unnamed protein product [Callosobruchus analis]